MKIYISIFWLISVSQLMAMQQTSFETEELDEPVALIPIPRMLSLPEMFAQEPSNQAIVNFITSAGNGNLNAVSSFLERYPRSINVQRNGITALHAACDRAFVNRNAQDLHLVEYLMSRGATTEIPVMHAGRGLTLTQFIMGCYRNRVINYGDDFAVVCAFTKQLLHQLGLEREGHLPSLLSRTRKRKAFEEHL